MLKIQKYDNLKWMDQMNLAFTNPIDLWTYLKLPISHKQPFDPPPSPFPFIVSRQFAEKIEKGNEQDPLLLQVLPQLKEKQSNLEFLDDAVDDTSYTVAPGAIHKYRNRILLLSNFSCAIHCRYCFRRMFPLNNIPHTRKHWEPTWKYIRCHEELTEIILSGGDPLYTSNEQIDFWIKTIASFPHITTLRIHTRIPIALPSRIEAGLLSLLEFYVQSGNQMYIIIQVNHKNELNDESIESIKKLQNIGLLIFNQSVLLKNINDTITAQKELSQKLIKHNIIPYYLHQLDKVTGAAHFEVNEECGKKLFKQMSNELPGYALPRYVKDIPGLGAKQCMLATGNIPSD